MKGKNKENDKKKKHLTIEKKIEILKIVDKSSQRHSLWITF